MLNRLREAKIIPDRFDDSVKRLTQTAQSQKLISYLAHEYLNAHWKPLYRADVSRALTSAKLRYVGSASLLRNFENFLLTQQQISLLNEMATAEIRELLKDFSVEHMLNQDVYVRGARAMHAK